MKKKIEENILCLVIILCPILDIASFLFRNVFNTSFSPSTFLRPILPTIVLLYLFFKKDTKFKMLTIGFGLFYGIYAILHLYAYSRITTGSSYSGTVQEAQYLINYTYMIMNLWIYSIVFKDANNIEKLSKSVLLANVIYIVSILVSILTKTSSNTYVEGMGYKGWFESGNSLGAILILSLFVILKYVKDKKYRKIAIPTILAEGIFLTTLLGTRVGLLGFIITIVVYLLVEVIIALKQKQKINKKMIAGGIASIAIVSLVVITIGSTTVQRRKHLKDIEKNIVDVSQKQEAHVTGDILKIKESIENNTLPEGYMGETEKQSILDLYEIANQMQLTNNDRRMQQLIYNTALIKNQNNPFYVLVGNGHLSNFRELILEMEIPSFFLDFGMMGFVLYLLPFLSIFMYGIYFSIQNRSIMDAELLMYLLGSGFVFAISFFAGYTFFNSSSMMIIIVLNTLMLQKINVLKKEVEIK